MYEVVEREQPLAIVEPRLGERHASNARPAVENRRNCAGASIGEEREQHTVESLRGPGSRR